MLIEPPAHPDLGKKKKTERKKKGGGHVTRTLRVLLQGGKTGCTGKSWKSRDDTIHSIHSILKPARRHRRGVGTNKVMGQRGG